MISLAIDSFFWLLESSDVNFIPFDSLLLLFSGFFFFQSCSVLPYISCKLFFSPSIHLFLICPWIIVCDVLHDCGIISAAILILIWLVSSGTYGCRICLLLIVAVLSLAILFRLQLVARMANLRGWAVLIITSCYEADSL